MVIFCFVRKTSFDCYCILLEYYGPSAVIFFIVGVSDYVKCWIVILFIFCIGVFRFTVAVLLYFYGLFAFELALGSVLLSLMSLGSVTHSSPSLSFSLSLLEGRCFLLSE